MFLTENDNGCCQAIKPNAVPHCFFFLFSNGIAICINTLENFQTERKYELCKTEKKKRFKLSAISRKG